MLQQVLNEIKAANGVINLNDLAKKLGIDRSALDGMIQFWVRKGRLKEDDINSEMPDACTSTACSSSCSGPKECPFVMTMPRTYSLAFHPPKDSGYK